nr:DASS family sodium-coupled anion symporter [Bacteroides coprosuis]
MAAVASKFQIDRKIANGVIGLIGTQSRYYLLGIMSVTGLCSMFISNTATAIMMLTMITPMLKQMSDTDKGRTALVLGVFVAANVGGIGTPIGTPPNAIVLKYLNDPAGMNLGIGFGYWMLVFVPFSIILIGISWLIISKLYPFSNPEMEKVDTMQVEEKGKCDLLMKYAVYCIFGTTIALWCFDSFFGVNPNVVAFVPICLFALLGVVGKKELAEIDWSVLWLISGGFALGLAFQESGLAHTLISGIDFSSIQPWVIIFSCWMVCWGLANVISHTAAVTLVTPIFVVLAMSLSQELAIFGGARTLLIGIAVFASLAMILPISTPPNALVYSTGFVQKKDLQTVGIIIGMIGLGLSSLLVFFIR